MSWTYGIRAVERALDEEADDVQELWLVQSDKPGPARRRLQDKARDLRLKIRMVSNEQLQRAVGEVNHQGVAARVQAFRYADEKELLRTEAGVHRCLVALDGVQDVHNLGAIIRSSLGLGAAGVVIPKHRAASVTPAVRRVSTGAVDALPVAQVTNLAKFLDEARSAGWWVYGTSLGDGAESLEQVSFAENTIFVFGNESEGIRDGVRKRCDQLVELPLEGVQSLNVSVAAGIFLYAWRRWSQLSE